MPAVTATKIDELNGLVVKARAIADEFKDKAMPAEKKTEFDTLHAKAIELRDGIKEDQVLEAKNKDIADMADWLKRPVAIAPLPTGPADAGDGRKALSERGWENKGNIWHAKTSLGLYPMYGDHVLFGNLPKGATREEQIYQRTARVAMQPEYKAAYDHYVRLCAELPSENKAFAMLEGYEQKALSEGTDTAGGMLVPPDYQAEMLVRKAAFAVVRRAGARVQPTSRDLVRYPMVNAAASTAGGLTTGGDSIFSSGFIGSWVGETPAFTDTDPKFGLFQVPVKKIRTATKLGNDFVSDSAVDIVAFLARNGAECMALVEDLGFLNGDGTALQPKGIFQAGASNTNLSGSTANTITNTSAAVGSAPRLITLWGTLPPQYDGDAYFLMSKGSEAAVRKLVDGQNRYLWPDSSGSMFAPPGGATTVMAPRALQGRPVLNTQFMVDGSAANAGAVAVLYGNFANYLIVERAQISTVILRERFADTDQIGIILFERVGGDTWNVDGFRYGIL